MSTTKIIAAVLTAFGLDAHAVSAAPLPAPPIDTLVRAAPTLITNPDWIAKPDAEDVDRFFPGAAQRMGLSGSARVTCGVRHDGTLFACQITSSSPPGFGFGAAGMAMTPLFKMRPRFKRGVPDDDGQVIIPIRFVVARDDDDSGPAKGTPTGRRTLGVIDARDAARVVLGLAVQETLSPPDYRKASPGAINALESMPATVSAQVQALAERLTLQNRGRVPDLLDSSEFMAELDSAALAAGSIDQWSAWLQDEWALAWACRPLVCEDEVTP